MRGVRKNCVIRHGETVIEILKSFEQVASRFSPTVLVVPGLTLVVLGLIAWLAGMCLRRLVLALAGAAAGGLAGWLISVQSPAVAGLAAGGGAVLGAILPRLWTAVLLAALGVAVAFVITTRASLVEGQRTLLGRQDAGQAQQRFTVPESLEAVQAFAVDIGDCVKSAGRKLGPADLIVIVAVGVGLLGLGLFLTRLAGALVCSVFGTLLIFVGLIVLLIFKGSAPVAFVQRQGAFYGWVLLGMAVFGTLEQLALCPSPRRRQKGGSGRPHSRDVESERSWRNH